MSDRKKQKTCYESCMKHNVTCPIKDCRYWMKYGKDLNCVMVAVEKHGCMTLREVSDRLGVSFVRIKQIQDTSLGKLSDAGVDMELFLKSDLNVF